MSFYVGGGTQELEYDFFTKTANSVVDCPMKIYKGEVDPDNLPSYTDALWTEITSQNIIDKLKEQNEITTSNLATDRSTIQWGDKTLTRTSEIKIVDDFAGKISGSVVENPNKAHVCVADSRKTPTDITGDWRTGFEESAQENINKISSLDNSCYTVTTSANIPQQLFSFNLIEIVERKYGSIPKETVAEKVEWLKSNLETARCNWYGYGSCPSGNKAYLALWYTDSLSWTHIVNHSSSVITQTTIKAINMSTKIDDNGFIHFLAYTDPSDGVTPSTICTDYISIELILKIPEATSEFYDFYTDSNNRRDAGLTNIVLVKKPIEGEPQDTKGYNYFTNESAEISVTTDNKASAFLIECDLTPICNSLYGGSNSALKSAIKSIEANVWAMGSGANGNELGYGVTTRLCFNNTWTPDGWTSTAISNISSISKLVLLTTTAIDKITSLNKIYIIIYSNYTSNGVIPSEVNLDYVNIKVKLARTPDVIPTIPIELGDMWSILLKGFSPSWDNNNITDNATVFGIIGGNNKFILRFNKTVGLFITWVNNKGEWTSFAIQNDIINKYNVFNILIQKKYDSINALCLKNNNEIISVDSKEAYTGVPSKSYVLGILQTYTNNYQADAFLDSIHLFNNKTFTDEEAEILLRGRNTIDTSNEYYNELAEQFKNPIIQTGYILPNNRYVITGQAKLYCNGYYTRTVQNCEFITTEKENKIELIGTAEVTRLD